MTSLATGSLTIPKQKIAPWLGAISNGSAVAHAVRPDPDDLRRGRVLDLQHRRGRVRR